MSNFHVGQKVVCVNDSKNGFRHFPFVKGRVYTVASAYLSALGNPIIQTEEEEGGWYASRFRPVIDRKTDISIFKAMLITPKVRIDA